MRSPSLTTLFFCACAVVCAAGLAWSALRASGSARAADRSIPGSSLPPEGRGGALDLEKSALDAQYERVEAVAEQVAAGGELPSAPTVLVRVHGRVCKDGRPVEDYELSFLRAGPDSEEEDWYSTDEDGRYEVELAVGRYDVRNDEEGPSLTSVVILAGEREVLLDIDLPR